MARKFGPFDDSVFYEVENRRLQRAFNPATGFVKSGQGAVTAGTGAQLVIAAYPDGALIDGMYVENPSSETVTLTTNTASTNPRIDRLVMRLDMNAKTIEPFQIVGTPAASPQTPPLVNTATVVDMPLVRYRFPGSASAQNPGSIVNERVTTQPARFQTFQRPTGTTGTDVYTSAAGFTDLVGGTWANALSGDYLIHSTLMLNGSVNIPGELKVTCGGSVVSQPVHRADVPTAIVGTISNTHGFTFAGGDLVILIEHKAGAAGNVTVYNASTKAVVEYLGPRS